MCDILDPYNLQICDLYKELKLMFILVQFINL